MAEASDATVTPTRARRCISRQFAHFYEQHQALPAGLLETFIDSRCGAPSSPRHEIWHFETPPKATPAKLARRSLTERRESFLDAFNEDQHASIGVWYRETDESAVAVLSYQRRRIEFDSFSQHRPVDDTFEIRGKTPFDTERMFGKVTAAGPATRDCEAVDGVELPRFHLRCPINSHSAWTSLSLRVSRPGESLVFPAASGLVWKKSSLGRVFRARDFTPTAIDKAADGKEGVSDAERFMVRLNAVRQSMDLEPFTWHPAQSQTIARIGDHIFQPRSGEDIPNRKEIGRAIRAGWDVDAPITRASFKFGGSDEDSTGSLLDVMLTNSSMRGFFLSKHLDEMVVGLTRSKETENLVYYFAGYQTVDEVGLGKRIESAISQVNEARRKHGREPVANDGSVYAAAKRIAGRLESGEWTPREAEVAFREACAEKWSSKVWSNARATQDYDEFDVPETPASQSVGRIAVTIAPYRPPGRAHVSYIVLFAWSRQLPVFAPRRREAAGAARRGAEVIQGATRLYLSGRTTICGSDAPRFSV